ncbi:MAG: hypothetical protein KIT79_07330 [Deltaproteobacteria bacterium]|nr:hypothetical protein [Deltaproteobacteria bacterium]
MIEPTSDPAYFSALCVKIPGVPDRAGRFWTGFFSAVMAIMAARIIWFLYTGGAPRISGLDILLGLALTAGLFGFLFTHNAWGRPSAENGRYLINGMGVSFIRENRTDGAAPDWKAGWPEIRAVTLQHGRPGLLIGVETRDGQRLELLADLARTENCPPAVRTADIPAEIPRPHAQRLIVRALWHFGGSSLACYPGTNLPIQRS